MSNDRAKSRMTTRAAVTMTAKNTPTPKAIAGCGGAPEKCAASQSTHTHHATMAACSIIHASLVM